MKSTVESYEIREYATSDFGGLRRMESDEITTRARLCGLHVREIDTGIWHVTGEIDLICRVFPACSFTYQTIRPADDTADGQHMRCR